MINEIYGKEYIKSLKHFDEHAFKKERYKDIIEKLQAYNTELLAQNEQLTKFKFLFEYSTDFIHILDENGNIVLCSKSFYEELGYTKKEILKLNINDIDKNLPAKKIEENLNNIFVQNKKLKFQSIHTRKDGSTFSVEVNSSQIEFNNKVYCYASTRNITDLLRYQNELILNTKSATMGNMLDAIAHQWTQTLNEISLYNSTIDFEVSNNILGKKSILDKTKSISESINHMSDTLGEFRTFMRPEIKKVDFKVSSQIEKAISLTKGEMKISKIDIMYLNKNDFMINGYPNQFVHVILNLINNSKYELKNKNIKNKNITIINSNVDGKNKIYFLDNAGGIPQDILPNIFENNMSTKGDKGSGMGLYLTKLIIENHDGAIQAKNNNEGALFDITLNRSL